MFFCPRRSKILAYPLVDKGYGHEELGSLLGSKSLPSLYCLGQERLPFHFTLVECGGSLF